MISEDTFGRTPAAMYLVRILNEVDNPILSRSVGKRLTATNRMVNELMYAYQSSAIEAKTLANSLRLMRLEISNEPADESQPLVDQLRRNVQIGYIKRGIRLSTVARRAERVMENPKRRGLWERKDATQTIINFFDKQSQKLIEAGGVYSYSPDDEHYYTSVFYPEDVSDVTPELLMERSNRRCLRQGKPHMKEKAND